MCLMNSDNINVKSTLLLKYFVTCATANIMSSICFKIQDLVYL